MSAGGGRLLVAARRVRCPRGGVAAKRRGLCLPFASNRLRRAAHDAHQPGYVSPVGPHPPSRSGLLRRHPLQPPILEGLSNRPYGVFFVAGRHFNGFHVRFSDIARGGLRVVLPPSPDIHVAESRRHFSECFRLAWAQQLKNKDIPEGGAKAVCLVYPVPGQDRTRLLHKCVKKFAESLLDLICPRQNLAPLWIRHGLARRLLLVWHEHALCGRLWRRHLRPGHLSNIAHLSRLPAIAHVVQLADCIAHATAAYDLGRTWQAVGLVLARRAGRSCREPWRVREGADLPGTGREHHAARHQLDGQARRAARLQDARRVHLVQTGRRHQPQGVRRHLRGRGGLPARGLLAVGIDPSSQPFTIKITGGPDSDVAGNMLRILHRDYGERVSVVGICDGFGAVEDPDGIPMAELLRLADAQLNISKLNPETLGPRGCLTLADTPEGAARRNTMHNRVVADAFVPAGGRPSTVNASNWRDFLQADGITPSARLVVEGANLFFDKKARQALFDHCGSDRISIIKDSSANKCGVICSSMEIVASMILDEDEFKTLKPRYVPQVLERLRELARLEARMLFTEAARDRSVALPTLSERISVAILRVGRALDDALDKLPRAEQQTLFPLVRESIPPELFSEPSIELRARMVLPWPYQRSCITSGLASRLVYREGLAFVEGLPNDGLATFAQAYLRGEQHTRELSALVAAANLSFGSEVMELLMKGGGAAAEKILLLGSAARAGEEAPAYPVLAE